MGKFKKIMEITSNAGYTADEGESDTGFIKGDEKRTLGTLAGKPDPWFARGGYTQTSFPKADYIYGKEEEEKYTVIKSAYYTEIDKQFEAEFQKWEKWIPEKNFKIQNIIDLDENSYYRKAMKYSLMERVDYMDTAKQLVKKYNLRSKVKMGSGKNFGDYIPETDTITLRPSYKSMKEFLMTILHEIKHAKDAYRLGVKKFMKKYTQAGTVAVYQGLDPHDDNKWEEKAENFAKAEIRKYI